MNATTHLETQAPELLAFLPLLYVAWADGDLDDDEIRVICERTNRAQGPGRCRELVGRWLDPAKPPSPAELQSLLTAVRARARELPRPERLDLRALGVELAKAGGREPTRAEHRALAELERALGLGAERSARLVARRRPSAGGGALAPGPARPRGRRVSSLRALLDSDHRAIRDRVKAILSEPEFALSRVVDLDRGAYREQVLSWARTLADRGLGALSYPASFGGAGDAGGFLAAFETLALHDLSLLVKFGVQFGLFGGSILHLGDEAQQARYLERAGTLELPGCFAMTETGHGSDVQSLETTARYDSETETFVIDTPHERARKDYIGNAAQHGRLATVFAQLESGGAHGVHAFLVPIRDADGAPCPGVRIEDCGPKLGLEGVDNGRLWFENVRVPRQALLGRFGRVRADGTYESSIPGAKRRFFATLGTLVGGRVSVATAALSATKVALTIAVRYAERRRQFGREDGLETTLLDFPAHQRRLLPRLAETYAVHFALRDLARRYVDSEPTGDERREVETLAAALKAHATWQATDTIQTCREACGGQGYLRQNRFAALKADTDVFTTFEGDNTVLLQLVARSLLTGLKRRFGGLDLFGKVRLLAERARSVVAERNPIATRTTAAEHLVSRDFHRSAFRHREEAMLTAVARSLKRCIDDGDDPFDAFVAHQEPLLDAARAYTERWLVERFAEAVTGVPEPELRALLRRVYELFALSRLEANLAWFLESGTFAPVKARAVRQEAKAARRRVRKDAALLVEGFGIPDVCLGAPIALP